MDDKQALPRELSDYQKVRQILLDLALSLKEGGLDSKPLAKMHFDATTDKIFTFIDAYTEQRVAETRIDELGEVLGRMIDWKNWGDLQDVYEELSKKLEGYEAQLKASTNQGGLEKPEETNNHE